MAWWQDRNRLGQFVVDLLYAELAKLRPEGNIPLRPWPEDLQIGEVGLGCDSLERLALAAALGEALRLDRSGLEDHLLARSSIGAWIDLAELCLQRYDGSMVFLTSGSSGEPKRCEHARATLEEEADFLAGLFAGRRRIVAAVSSRHIYGFLFTVLLPGKLGVPLLRRLDKSTVGLSGDLLPGDLVIGFPDFWRLAARSVDRLPPDLVATTSTAPFPADLGATLADRGLARLVEIYGSSETAGIGWRDVPASDFRLFPYWTRSGQGDALIRRHPDGADAEQCPPDYLHWTSEGSFRPQGRRDDAFQVGGINVHPRHVEAVLARHPLVAAAKVRRMRPEEGDRVKAFVVPNGRYPDDHALARELARWCDDHLIVAERPKSFRFGADFPRDALGKAVDWDISKR